MNRPAADAPAARPSAESPAATRHLRWPKDRHERLCWGAVVVGFLLRLTWAVTMTRTPSPSGPSPLIGDWYSTWNLRIADQFSRGQTPNVVGLHTAYWPPGMGMLLAPIAWCSRHFGVISLNFGASLVNVVAGTLTVIGVGALAQLWFSARARSVAVWLMALAPGHIFATSVAVNETLLTATLVLAIWGATTIVKSRTGGARHRPLLLLGVLVGYAVLVKDLSGLLLFLPALAVRAIDGSWRGALRCTLAVLLGSLVILAPWAVRNGVQVGWWSPTSTNSSEGVCAGRFPQGREMAESTHNGNLVAPANACLRNSPFDDPRLGLAAYLPKGFVFDQPHEAQGARRRTQESLRWYAEHPMFLIRHGPVRMVEAAGNDTYGGFDMATSFGRRTLLPHWATTAAKAASNAWYYLVAVTTLVALAARRSARRALPLWLPVIVFLLYPALGPYGYSRHFFPAYPFLVVLASSVFAAIGLPRSTGSSVDVDTSAPVSLPAMERSVP